MKILDTNLGGRHNLLYWCQGCDELHRVTVDAGHPQWFWNGDRVNPTFSPSVLIRRGHHHPDSIMRPDGKCDYCERNRKICKVCHTYITGGMVKFLSDCTHKYAGTEQPLPDLPQWVIEDYQE